MAIIISFLAISAHGASLEIVDEAGEKILINLEFRDAGSMRWPPNSYCCTLRIPNYPPQALQADLVMLILLYQLAVKNVCAPAMLREFKYLVSHLNPFFLPLSNICC